MQGKEMQVRERAHQTAHARTSKSGFHSLSRSVIGRAVCAAFAISFIFPATSVAAIPAGSADDTQIGWEITADRWQRFLTASRSRYQALAEKAGVLQGFTIEECVAAQLSLAERRECLRSDVFARTAMEHDGMVLDEYATVLHLTVAALPQSPISAQQRGQFQRLRAEWWPAWRTASQ